MVVEGHVHQTVNPCLAHDVVIFEGELEWVRRFKDDVGKVRSGMDVVLAELQHVKVVTKSNVREEPSLLLVIIVV